MFSQRLLSWTTFKRRDINISSRKIHLRVSLYVSNKHFSHSCNVVGIPESHRKLAETLSSYTRLFLSRQESYVYTMHLKTH